MALIALQNVSVAFGGPLLLDNINLRIEHGERICLIGRNGVGKSTLMRIVNGDLPPDSGEIIKDKNVRTAMLEQDVPANMPGTVFGVVKEGLLASLNNAEDKEDEWDVKRRVETVLSRLHLDGSLEFKPLSSGLKRRVMMARALVTDPDILLLDEPTNHLDIDSITWLEEFLLKNCPTILFVSHDRKLLRRLSNRIIDLDRGGMADWACGYDEFLKRKQDLLDTEIEQSRQFDKKLAKEEEWITKGIRARRTRNEGRVKALLKMREERAQRRDAAGTVKMSLQEAERTGKLVIEAENVGFSYGQPIIKGFSTRILRGDRIGIIGPNGSGKTTLLKVLLGELEAQSGRVRHGARLEISYFDQVREQLDEEKTVEENIAEGREFFTINGVRRHIVGYLKDFLFTPQRAKSPVKALSGGERSRLLLARLFTKPSNVLVMDEPTNDLDAETLELLEELLMDYSGTLLLVSHDREFLNNVVAGTLVLEGEGAVGEYVGGYDDWLMQRKVDEPADKKEKTKKPKPKAARPRKLSFNEKRELEELPKKIEDLEEEQKSIFEMMGEPTFYQKDGADIAEARSRLEIIERELESAYERWEELDSIES